MSLLTRLIAFGGLLSLAFAQSPSTPSNFTINFTDLGTECGVFPLTWTGGQPPYRVIVAPLDGSTLIYDIPTSSNNSFPLELELSEGTRYTLFMSDANRQYSYSTLLRTVGPRGNGTRAFCSGTLSTRRTDLATYVTLGGTIRQCDSFKGYMTSSGGRPGIDYNFTVMPLDQSFTAFDVDIDPEEESKGIWNWVVGMTQGMKFTIMFNSQAGIGVGGVGGIYEVKPPPNTTVTCSTLVPTSTVLFLSAYATSSLGVLGAAIRSVSSASASASRSRAGTAVPSAVTAAGSSGENLKFGTGPIVGISVVCVLLLSVCFIAILYRSRRREQVRVNRMEEANRAIYAARAEGLEDSIGSGRISPTGGYRYFGRTNSLPAMTEVGRTSFDGTTRLPDYTRDPEVTGGEDRGDGPPAYNAHTRDARI